MRKLLIIALLPAFCAGCYIGGSQGGMQGKTFAQQYAALEREGVPPRGVITDARALQTDADREAEVALAAQKERRAQPPLVESNYIFQVLPDKGVYSFDEYNQVWTGEPKEKDYKGAKRLWAKPKRHKGEYDAAAEAAAAKPPPAPAKPAAPDYDEDDDDEGEW